MGPSPNIAHKGCKMFKPLEILCADPEVVALQDWSGFVLSRTTKFNNSDVGTHVALCASSSSLRRLVDEALNLEQARWDWGLFHHLPISLELQRWERGACVERSDLRPTIDVHGLSHAVQVVPSAKSGWTLLIDGVLISDEEADAKLQESESTEASFTATIGFCDEVGEEPPRSLLRPISPLYEKHGEHFIQWITESAYYGFAEGWDGSVPYDGWVAVLGLCGVNEEPYAGDFAEFLEELEYR